MATKTPAVSRKFVITVRVLLVMIVTLMALGAGVRTMNAGLSCPDWPLCFGKVIPDFHPGVYFEFIHRAYAGLVSLVFFACCVYVFRSKTIARGAKIAAGIGIFVLLAQIIMGGLTVLRFVEWEVVTSHLMLATFFFCSVLFIHFNAAPAIEKPAMKAPTILKYVTGFLAFAVLFQIYLGGAVASTYAGSVCVDWPMCNGQWVPTWAGAIGRQIIHRFVAYFLAVAILAYALVINSKKKEAWVTPQLLKLSRWNMVVVFAQVGLGIANLLFYIPPGLAVPHQSVGIILLAVNLRTFFVARSIAREPVLEPAAIKPSIGQAVGVSG